MASESARQVDELDERILLAEAFRDRPHGLVLDQRRIDDHLAFLLGAFDQPLRAIRAHIGEDVVGALCRGNTGPDHGDHPDHR